MKKFIIKTKTRKLLADTITPVSIYLRIRDVFPNSLLLESSDYHGNENSYSFICLKPLAGFEVNDGVVKESYPDGSTLETRLTDPHSFKERFRGFLESFGQQEGQEGVVINGLFGYTSYDAIKYFENIEL
jgi:anthranilate synthase component 1